MSIKPRARRSATRRRVLVGVCIEVATEHLVVERWGTGEHRHRCFGADEAMTSERNELAHRDTAAGDDEGLAAVELAHDLPALVPKLSLRYLPGHGPTAALRATDAGP